MLFGGTGAVPGLVLRVTPDRKAWTLVYKLHGQRLRMTLGVFPVVDAYHARIKATEALRAVPDGGDPRVTETQTMLSFGVVAWLSREKEFPGPAEKSRKEWGRLLDVEILPTLTDLNRSISVGRAFGSDKRRTRSSHGGSTGLPKASRIH